MQEWSVTLQMLVFPSVQVAIQVYGLHLTISLAIIFFPESYRKRIFMEDIFEG